MILLTTMSLLLSSPYTIVGDVFAQTNSSNSTNTDTTTDTTNSGDLQQFTTYNFNEVTFQGSHVWATTTGHSPTFKAETSGSVYPISSLVGGPEDFTAQVEGTGKVKMTATR